MTSEWQDISTAPKDGTKFIIAKDDAIYKAYYDSQNMLILIAPGLWENGTLSTPEFKTYNFLLSSQKEDQLWIADFKPPTNIK